ncbi:hypothetical protein CYY_009963 [Polysphondylium violaceum]|uniref:Uncharacterized protein n=1 Tax=Polysphondylium violaceum TaxID=133409 RepID=A0A8J4PSM3_9MYCE|nr:hypothetical protein CYY_009963 [Polysphondylium violaceum]
MGVQKDGWTEFCLAAKAVGLKIKDFCGKICDKVIFRFKTIYKIIRNLFKKPKDDVVGDDTLEEQVPLISEETHQFIVGEDVVQSLEYHFDLVESASTLSKTVGQIFTLASQLNQSILVCIHNGIPLDSIKINIELPQIGSGTILPSIGL